MEQGTASHAELVRTAFAGWERGDSRPFFALVSPGVRWRVIGSTALSGTHVGLDAFLAVTRRLFDRLAEPLVAKVLAVHDVGDTVVLQWEGTSRGVNGRPYRQSYCWVLRFSEGMIAEVVAYLDTALVDDMFAD